MHNKVSFADNVLGITGGGDLGNEYFGNAADGNFVDLAVLVAGPRGERNIRQLRPLLERQACLPRAEPMPRETLVEGR